MVCFFSVRKHPRRAPSLLHLLHSNRPSLSSYRRGLFLSVHDYPRVTVCLLQRHLFFRFSLRYPSRFQCLLVFFFKCVPRSVLGGFSSDSLLSRYLFALFLLFLIRSVFLHLEGEKKKKGISQKRHRLGKA